MTGIDDTTRGPEATNTAPSVDEVAQETSSTPTEGEPAVAGQASSTSTSTPTSKPTSTSPENTEPTDETASADATPSGPTLVKRVVCSYKLGWLPGDWLQTWRRLDRLFVRSNLKVKATLAPLEDLPEDTDILVVSPDLREAAREAARPGTPILVTPASAAASAFADLVARLEAGTEFTAEHFDPSEKDKPKIVSYRGHTIID